MVENSCVVLLDLDAYHRCLVAGRLRCIWVTVVQCVLLTLEELLLEVRRVDHGWTLVLDRAVLVWRHVAVPLSNLVVYLCEVALYSSIPGLGVNFGQ